MLRQGVVKSWETCMEARRLIEGAAFGPDTLKVIREAFDKAWSQIEATYGNDPRDIEKGRLRLARAVLDVANTPVMDAEQLARAALEAMALGYKRKP